MRKEVILAIVIGFALGLVITFGVWTANQALKSQKAETPVSTVTTPPTEVTPPVTFVLDITSPEDGALVNEAKVMVSGRTQPDSTITITSEKGEDIVLAGADGTFANEVSLVNGTNEITITAFNLEGEEVTKTINLVYSTAEI